MSRGIASAKQRRAGFQPEPPSIPSKPSISGQTENGGLTLQQVIALVDTRLVKLEKFMKDSQEAPYPRVPANAGPAESGVQGTDGQPIQEGELGDLNSILDDFNNRFVVLAEELSQLKDVVLKLQSYTMDVNKLLLEERVNILSDLGEDKSLFTMNNIVPQEVDILAEPK